MAIAFGLTVLTGVYAIGTISGGHFNPAVTLGAALAKRVEWKALPAYWSVQVIGGLLAGLVIYLIAKGNDGFSATGTMAANGFGAHSPGGYSLSAGIGLLSGGYGREELERSGAYRVYADPAEMLTRLEEVGVRPIR